MILKTVSIQAYYVILFIAQKKCIRFAQCPKDGKKWCYDKCVQSKAM